MARLITRRLMTAALLLVIITFLVLALVDLAPGDAATRLAGDGASPEQIQQVREDLDLDDPLLERYGRWASDAVTGDLGTSLFSSQSVSSAIGDRLPVTLSLAATALLITVVVALVLGVIAANWPHTLVDRFVTAAAALTMSLPPFVVGVLAVTVFAIQRSWLPATGYSPVADDGYAEWARHLILPGAALAAASTAELARQIRGSLIDAMRQDYVRTARAKGLTRGAIVCKHAMKNAAIPILTVLGLQVGRILGGAVTVEFIFVMPGFGQLALTAVEQQDIPMIQGVVVVSAISVLVINLLVDISYGLVNPKLRRA